MNPFGSQALPNEIFICSVTPGEAYHMIVKYMTEQYEIISHQSFCVYRQALQKVMRFISPDKQYSIYQVGKERCEKEFLGQPRLTFKRSYCLHERNGDAIVAAVSLHQAREMQCLVYTKLGRCSA